MDDLKFINTVLDLRREEKKRANYNQKDVHIFIAQGNKYIKAKITGISEYGKLILQTKNNETYSCDFKEMEFVIYDL